MACGKNPTRRQRAIMSSHRLKTGNWLVVKNPPGELHLVHKLTGNKGTIRYG